MEPSVPIDPVPRTPDTEDLERSVFGQGFLADTTNLREVQDGPSPYTDTTFDVRYDLVSGVSVLPPAVEDDATTEVVKLHTRYWTKVVAFSYERQNEWPVCPHPETGNLDEVLIGATITVAKPADGPNKLRIYRVTGEYRYYLKTPPPLFGPFPTGVSPESYAGREDNAMPSSSFDRAAIG